jgi:hypothetical protein
MNLTMLSALEAPYGGDARGGEVVAFKPRRPLPPAQRWRRAVEYAYRDAFLDCSEGIVYGEPLPRNEEPLVFPRLVDPDE